MDIIGTFTTLVLLFVIFSFLSAIWHYMKREAREKGWGLFTEGFSGYRGAKDLGIHFDDHRLQPYPLGQPSPLATHCGANPARNRCGNNYLV